MYSARVPKVASISRLRRVCASMITACSRRSRVSTRRCGNAARCVSFAYCSKQPAAPTPAGASSASKPARSSVPNCSQSRRLPVPGSKCHGGLRRAPAKCPSHGGTSTSSASKSSAGFNRSSSACSASTSCELREAEAPAGEVEPREARCSGVNVTAASSRVSLSSSSAASVTVPGVTTRTTSRATGPFARRRVADLLADRDRLAEPHEPREIGLGRVHGHAGHRDRLAARLAAARQRDVDQLRRASRVVVEQLVEIAHAIEQQRVRKPRLDGVVLLHDGRVLRTSHRVIGADFDAAIVVARPRGSIVRSLGAMSCRSVGSACLRSNVPRRGTTLLAIPRLASCHRDALSRLVDRLRPATCSRPRPVTAVTCANAARRACSTHGRTCSI